jgi:hypothetical protein
MLKKHHQILAAVLLVQIALSVVIFWPRPSTAGQREPLFKDLEVGDVTALTIEDGEGNSIELAKVTGEWVLPRADQYPAKSDAIKTFLEKVTALTTGRLVTRSDTSHKRLQVAADDFARRIRFETGDGTEETVYIGSSPQYGSVHFRLEGEDETYLTSELTTWDVNAAASAWIDPSYQSVAQDEITKMTLENANGTFVFERASDDTWTMDLSSAGGDDASLGDDEVLDQASVSALLRRAASVTMKRPLGKEAQDTYGIDEPLALVTLETADKTLTLRVGANDADDSAYVVKSSESDYYVEVATASVAALVENDREAFLKQPTPEADSSGS